MFVSMVQTKQREETSCLQTNQTLSLLPAWFGRHCSSDSSFRKDRQKSSVVDGLRREKCLPASIFIQFAESLAVNVADADERDTDVDSIASNDLIIMQLGASPRVHWRHRNVHVYTDDGWIDTTVAAYKTSP